MQLICDGLQPKREVLDHTIEQFKEVYIKAKREFEVVINVRPLPSLERISICT
jgi:DNA topoisomerase-3